MKQLGTDHTVRGAGLCLEEKCHLFLTSQLVVTAGDNILGSLGFVDSHICTAAMGNEELTGALKSWSVLNVNNGNTLLQSRIQHRDVQRYKVNH